MIKNVIQYIVNSTGEYLALPVEEVTANDNNTTRIQLVCPTPTNNSVSVHFTMYDSLNQDLKQYMLPSSKIGADVVDKSSEFYKDVADWNVFEIDVSQKALSYISKYRAGRVGVSFKIVERVPSLEAVNYKGLFGIGKPLPADPEFGDYVSCDTFNYILDEKLYNKGDILYYTDMWEQGSVLEKLHTETEDLSVSPSLNVPDPQYDENEVGLALAEMMSLIALKQNITDEGLTTSNKTVVGAINELNTHADIIDGELTNLDGKINNVDNKVELIIPKANGAVRFDITQTLSESEKSRARINIGVAVSGKIDMIIVSELPEIGESGTIYLLPNENPESSNLYTEWVYINDEWELWGISSIDLSDYITYTQDDSNVGKTFVVGEDGRVELVDFPKISLNGIDYLKDPAKTYLVIKTPADNDTFTLLTGTAGSPNYTIEWGDGESETITTTDNPSHEYETAGMYLITISGAFENGIVVGSGDNVNKDKIIEFYGGSNYPLSIGGNAFYGCTSLTTANFPNMTSIGDFAFVYCTSLTIANFTNATSIGAATFYGCTSLTTANFPNVTSTGGNAFYGCTSLTTANFPNMTSIGDSAFAFCPSLTIANFPNMTSIGISAFYDCTSLKELTIGNVLTTITGKRFRNVKLVNLKIVQDVTNTDIDRIKQFYANNGGIFIGNETKHGLQVEKQPVADNDVVRKVDLSNYATNGQAFNKVYKSLSDLTGIDASSTLAQLCDAMAYNSYLNISTSGYANLVPTGETDLNGQLEIIKVNENRVRLAWSYQNSSRQPIYFATYRNNGGFLGWKRLITDSENQRITGIKTFDADTAKFSISASNTDYRYPLTSPYSTSTEKRFLLGVPASQSRYTNYNTNVYMENDKLYSNNSEVVNLADEQTISGVKTFKADVNIGEVATPKNLNIVGDLNITGDIIQEGSTYETHAEQIYSTKDEIILREGAVAGLATGALAKITAKLYDGTNDGVLGFDNNGYAKVGDVGSEQIIATREDTPTDDGVARWDASTLKFVTETPDTTPTDSSTKLVESGGVKTALDNKATKLSIGQWHVPYRDEAGSGEPNTSRLATMTSPLPSAILIRDTEGKATFVGGTSANQGIVKSQLDSAIATRGGLAGDNNWSGVNTFTNNIIGTLQGNASTSTNTSRLKGVDTRNNNETPEWYISDGRGSTNRMSFLSEFKITSVLGLSGSTYCLVLTVVPWGDATGGLPSQTAYLSNGEVYMRKAESATVWGAWRRLATTEYVDNAIQTAIQNSWGGSY